MVLSTPKFETKRQGLAVWACMILSATLGGYSAFVAADRNAPVDILSAEATTPFVAPGGTLRIGYTVFRRKQCDVTVDQFVIDAAGTRHILPDLKIGRGLPLGGDRFGQIVVVPDQAVQGPAIYRTVPNYVCNVFNLLSSIPGGSRDVDFIVRN